MKEKTKELRENELVIFKGRIFRVETSKFDNGKMQGNRVILKLLKDKELNIMFVEMMKGGLSE